MQLVHSSKHRNRDINSFFTKQTFFCNWIIFSIQFFLVCKLIKIIKLLIKGREKQNITVTISNIDRVK